jgi:hypothetical protein
MSNTPCPVPDCTDLIAAPAPFCAQHWTDLPPARRRSLQTSWNALHSMILSDGLDRQQACYSAYCIHWGFAIGSAQHGDKKRADLRCKLDEIWAGDEAEEPT